MKLLLMICVLCTGVNCQGPTIAGHLFTAFQSGDNLTISVAVVNPSGNTTSIDVVFLGVQLPSSCGDRNARCDLTVSVLDGSTRVAVTAAVGNGAVIALFDQENNELIFVEQFFLSLPETTCSLTTFVQDPVFIYGLCYEFTNVFVGLVQMDVYRFGLNFFHLNLSSLQLHATRSMEFDISQAFFSSCTSFDNIYWLGNAYLYSLRVDVANSLLMVQADLDTELQDPAIAQCFDNGTQQLVLFEDSFLLAYCNNTITVQVDFCRGTVSVITETRFYCSGRSDIYITERDSMLSVNLSMEYSATFPLNLSLSYMGDCIEINEQIFFIGSSADGTIALTDVLSNSTTVLTTNALVDHQVVDDRFVLYSDPTSSAILDLSCPVPSTPIHVNNVNFELSAFSANEGFSCLTVQPTTPPPTTPDVTTETTTNSPTTKSPTNGTIQTTDMASTMTTESGSNDTKTTDSPTTGVTNVNTTAIVVPIVILVAVVVFVAVVVLVLAVRLKKRNENNWLPAPITMAVIDHQQDEPYKNSNPDPYHIASTVQETTISLDTLTPKRSPEIVFTASNGVQNPPTPNDTAYPEPSDVINPIPVTNTSDGHSKSALLTYEPTAAGAEHWLITKTATNTAPPRKYTDATPLSEDSDTCITSSHPISLVSCDMPSALSPEDPPETHPPATESSPVHPPPGNSIVSGMPTLKTNGDSSTPTQEEAHQNATAAYAGEKQSNKQNFSFANDRQALGSRLRQEGQDREGSEEGEEECMTPKTVENHNDPGIMVSTPSFPTRSNSSPEALNGAPDDMDQSAVVIISEQESQSRLPVNRTEVATGRHRPVAHINPDQFQNERREEHRRASSPSPILADNTVEPDNDNPAPPAPDNDRTN